MSNPITPKQSAFLSTLADQKGVTISNIDELDTIEASQKIDELKSTVPDNTTTAEVNTKSSPNQVVEDSDTNAVADLKPNDPEYLNHPDVWATAADPATDKQKAFIAVLDKKSGGTGEVEEELSKAEASKRINELK